MVAAVTPVNIREAIPSGRHGQRITCHGTEKSCTVREHAQRALDELAAEARNLNELCPIDPNQLRALEGRVPLTEQKLQNFADAVIQCHALEDVRHNTSEIVDDATDKVTVGDDDVVVHVKRSDDFESLFICTCGLLTALRQELEVVEDILIFDQQPGRTHMERVRDVLQRCSRAGITLGKKKFIYAKPSVVWCGYHLSNAGYTINLALVEVDVRSFCGLVQQFEAFLAEIADLDKPLRSMLSSKVDFMWEGHQQKAFEDLIKFLTVAAGSKAHNDGCFLPIPSGKAYGGGS
eukprot:TCALIF_13786-PA protein Name:"Similar to Tf2-9 Transposon Tf2-9 polyprotein (Schizosaccharomyces pombe (strain 972 / ATCC 24843))" AED:0.54 eAED:0.54 QI:0/0/0/0.25/1/1/4/0/291